MSDLAQALDYQSQINKQQQTPYAAQNGMNTGGVQQQALDNAISGSGSGATANFADVQSKSEPTTQETTTENKTGASSTSQTSTNIAGGIAGTSPVTGDGKINEANAPAPPAPVQMPATSSTSSTSTKSTTPAPAPGWVNVNGNWVPPDHPMAQGPISATPAQTVGAPGWQPGTPGQTGSLGSMAASQLSIGPGGMPMRQATTEYNPGTLDQYGGQINGQMEAQVQQALSQAIAGGGGLPVEMMKGAARDNGMAMRDNELQQMHNQLAGMGRTGGGFQAAMDANLRENALQGVLGQYRDIGIEDAKSRNQFGLQAIEAGNSYLTGQQNRMQDNFKTRQGGQLAQENLLLDAAGNNRNNYLADLQGFLGNKGIDQAASASSNSLEGDKYRARLGLMGDLMNIMERARSGDQSTGLGHSQIAAGLLGQL